MNEDQMNQTMLIASMIMTAVAGLTTVGLLIECAIAFSLGVLICSMLAGLTTIGFGWATTFYGRKVTGHALVFNNDAEREVLTPRQRRELRRKRGEVVMEKALIEVEHERQNITHRQIEAANDPDQPPYETRWSHPEEPKVIHQRHRVNDDRGPW